MEPYYDQDGIVIFNADCRDVLPTLDSGGVVVTDPPWGIGLEYEGYEDSADALDELIATVWPLMERFPMVALTPGVGNMYSWPKPTWTMSWFTAAGAGSSAWGFCTWQPIHVYGACLYQAGGLGRRPDGIAYTPKGNPDKLVGHPCPKPLGLMRWLIERVTVDTTAPIIDPFMGSGSTLRAAKDLGRRAIGVEQSEAYCEVAANRLAQGVLDLG
jgi:DNA modification methylase